MKKWGTFMTTYWHFKLEEGVTMDTIRFVEAEKVLSCYDAAV